MAKVLIKSYSAGFFVQISSQNREANISHPTGGSYKPSCTHYSIAYEHTKRSTDLSRFKDIKLNDY